MKSKGISPRSINQTSFRTWKSGKNWIFAAATTVALVGGTTFISTAVKADVGVLPNNTTVTSGVNNSTSATSSSVVASSITSSSVSTASTASTAVKVDVGVLSNNISTEGADSSVIVGTSASAIATPMVSSSASTKIDSYASTLAVSQVIGSRVTSSVSNYDSVIASSYDSVVGTSATVKDLVPISITEASSTLNTLTDITDTTVGDFVQQLISSVGISGVANILSQLGGLNIPGLQSAADALNGISNAVDVIGQVQNAGKTIGLSGENLWNSIGWIDSLVGSNLQGTLNDSLSGILFGSSVDVGTLLSLTGNDLTNYLTGLVVNAAINATGQAIWTELSPILNQIPVVGQSLSNVLGPILSDLSGASIQQVMSLTGVDGILSEVENVTSGLGDSWNTIISAIDDIGNWIQGLIPDVNGNIVAPQIMTKDTMLTQGDTWDASQNFVSALDSEGNAIMLSNLIVSGSVNTNVSGTYQITYIYTDVETGLTGTAMATVMVTPKMVSPTVTAHDTEIEEGTTWSPSTNFDSATDSLGAAVNFNEVTVSGTVNTTLPGKYQITYSYTDPTSGLVASTTVTVTVIEVSSAVAPVINANDSTITQGSIWNPEDNFVSAIDSEGNSIPFTAVTFSGNVDTSTPGKYQVTYSYIDSITGLSDSKTVIITVDIPTISAPVLHAVSAYIYTTQTYYPNLNFIAGTDSENNALLVNQVTYNITNQDGTIANLTVAGDYTVTFSYTDSATGLTGTTTSIIHITQDKTSGGLAPGL